MQAIYTPPVRYEFSRPQACFAYWQALAALGLTPTAPFLSVLVAHGGFECGNFAEGLWNCNPGNIKADLVGLHAPAWSGEFTCITVNEILERDGQNIEVWFSPEGELVGRRGSALRYPALAVPPGHAQTRMRAFSSLAEGVTDKIKFLLGDHWKGALEFAKRGDAAGYVRSIRAGGYFTAYRGQPDPTPYETSVVSLAHTYRPIVEAVGGSPVSTEPLSRVQADPLEAVRTDLIGDDLRARIVAAQAPILDSILEEARKRT